MVEVAALPRCGLRVASTFSGCGGSSLGYKMAGFDVVWASEFVPAARDTYRANFQTTLLDERDIRTVTPEDVLRATGLREGELDVLDGSPPCASFSTAGKRQKGWGEVKDYSDVRQRTDDLFFEFARILGGVRPRAFVAENVAGLVIGAAKGYFLEILAALTACGYRVGARVLDAQWLGVPQQRRRLIFVGFREDLGIDPVHPVPLPYRYSLREALPWLGTARVVHDTSGNRSAGDVTERPSPAVTVGVNGLNSLHFKVYEPGVVHVKGSTRGKRRSVDDPSPVVMANGVDNNKHGSVLLEHAPVPTEAELREADFERYAIGREWKKLKQGEGSDKYLNLVRAHVRAHVDRPSPTVTQTAGHVGAAGVAHPLLPRKFTIGELRRVCSFPDDFVLTGTYAQQWERLGRAVPPLMMRAVAERVRDALLAKGR